MYIYLVLKTTCQNLQKQIHENTSFTTDLHFQEEGKVTIHHLREFSLVI